MPRKLSLTDRFVIKTKKLANGCIIWTAQTDKDGYGKIWIGPRIGGYSQVASRVSYSLFIGHIPSGMRVLHDCPTGDNTSCVNPLHLWLGTDKDNAIDKCNKGRHPKLSGVALGTAKLTPDQVNDIRQRCSQGCNQRLVAEEFGINQSNVSRIFHRKRWVQ